nr:hypothetical protein ISGA_09185 [Gordonia sp. NB41Y]
MWVPGVQCCARTATSGVSPSRGGGCRPAWPSVCIGRMCPPMRRTSTRTRRVGWWRVLGPLGRWRSCSGSTGSRCESSMPIRRPFVTGSGTSPIRSCRGCTTSSWTGPNSDRRERSQLIEHRRKDGRVVFRHHRRAHVRGVAGRRVHRL